MKVLQQKTVYSEAIHRETGEYIVETVHERIIECEEIPSDFWAGEFVEYSFSIV